MVEEPRVDLDAEICPGFRARLAKPTELARCAELASLVGIDPAGADGGEFESLLNAPRLGAAVLAGAEFGVDRFRRYMSEVLAGDGLVAAAEAASLVLVAVTETDEIAGLLIAFPPSQVIQQHLDSPHATDRNRVMLGGITQLSKVRALAVDPKWRGRGIGAGLLNRYKAIYTACHYLHLYGQFEVPKRRGLLGIARSAVSPGDDLAAFYSRQGFTVLREREPLDFFVVFGIHGAIFPDRNERFFSYRRPSRG